MRPIDVEFMKHLHAFVNVVPVIAKADTLTIEERDSFKQRIREDLSFHGINIYPTAYGAEDEEDEATNTKIEVLVEESCLTLFTFTVLSPSLSFSPSPSHFLHLSPPSHFLHLSPSLPPFIFSPSLHFLSLPPSLSNTYRLR